MSVNTYQVCVECKTPLYPPPSLRKRPAQWPLVPSCALPGLAPLCPSRVTTILKWVNQPFLYNFITCVPKPYHYIVYLCPGSPSTPVSSASHHPP